MDPATTAGLATIFQVFIWIAVVFAVVALLQWSYEALTGMFDEGNWVVKVLLAIPIGLLAIPIAIINIAFVVALVLFGISAANSARDWWHKGK